MLYFMNSAVVTGLIALSFKYKRSQLLVITSIFLLCYMSNFRVFNFENIKDIMGDLDWNIHITKLHESSSRYIFFLVLLMDFKSKIWIVPFGVHVFILTYSEKYSNGRYNFRTVSSAISWYILWWVVRIQLKKLIKMVLDNKAENHKFKVIFDNQDESIIIINEASLSVEYLNKKF